MKSWVSNFNDELRFNNLSELRQSLLKEYPHLGEINKLPNFSKINFGEFKEIKNRNIEYNIKNFYMNDVISRSSITMAQCTRDILNKVA